MKLSSEAIRQYREEGYVIVENVFQESDLAPVIAAINEFVDQRAHELLAEGKISELHENEPFERRYASLYRQSKEIGKDMDIMYWRHPALFALLRNANLLDVAESLLGSELTCNPIQHIRAKMPYDSKGGEPEFFQNVPWHQDAGVTLEEADDSDIITFWFPLVDAVAETGCMEIIPQAFKLGQLKHQKEGGTTIVPDEMPNLPPKLAPCPKGGIVIMNKYTPHKGTPNRSDIVRWSVDLRYQRTGEPTGRPFHPAFVARSSSNPDSELTDHAVWSARWEEALLASKGQRMHRV
jgi:phytanoyl-CoA hydroxylase